MAKEEIKTLKFKCSKCGNDKIEEILVNVVQNSVIDVIDESGAIDYDPNIVTEEGEIDRYQCSGCGYVLKNDYGKISTPEDLVEWVKQKCPQE